jgi:type I restriction enzyme S subunit
MIEQLAAMPKYEAYKDSGAEWLENIPASWQVKRFKFLYRDVSQKGRANAELLSVTQNQGVVPRTWVENRMVMPSGNLESFKFIEKGDFAISLRSFEGGLEYCHHDGIISPAYTVLKRNLDSLCDGYYRFIFKSHAFISELQTSIVGIREGKNISFEELSYSLIPIPPIPEQTAIAAFLHRRTAQIDQAVAIKEKQNALLKERKQILIQNAVTRGLNPDTPMRDSGVEWIGEIPAHWEILANRALFKARIEPGKDGLPLLSVSIHTAVSSEEIPEDENIRGRIKIEDKSKYNLVQPGDIVFNMMRAWQGAIGAVKVRGMVSPAYIIAVPNEKIVSSYFEYQYRCPEFIQQMDRNSKGITDFRKRLYWGEFKQLLTVVPPTEEQAAIVAHIEIESTKIDRAISLQQQQIHKLKEYKATLINNAVTGKVRVPELDESSMPELVDSLVA